MKKSFRYSVILLLAAIGLNGCSTQPLTPQAGAMQPDHEARLSALKHWDITGKLGLRSPEQNGSANLQWQQRPGSYHILLTGPLGQGAVQIQGELHRVTLRGEDGVFSAASPEQLLEQHLGWQLPLSNLYYWVRGLPAPGLHAATQHNAQGQLETLHQNGWAIQYSRYDRVGDYYLPGKVKISDNRYRLTLIIKDWGI